MLVKSFLLIGLIVLFIFWIIYRSKARNLVIQLNIKDDYKRLKWSIKSTKFYKKVSLFSNIIMIITLIYLIYAIALTIIIVIFTVITLGAFQMASTHTLAKSMLDAQQFNHDIIPYVLYIFVSAIIIKNILFNVELHKFLKNSNIVTRK